jgi:hypothetical protein
MIYYFSEKYFPAHKKQAALQEIFNFVQIEEESLPQASGKIMRRLLRDVAEGRALGNVTTLADASVVQMLKDKYEEE